MLPKILRKLISYLSSAIEMIRKIILRQRSICKLYGTIFCCSKIPFNKWCQALIEWSILTGSISAEELSRRLNIKYDLVWRMLMKIRQVLADFF